MDENMEIGHTFTFAQWRLIMAALRADGHPDALRIVAALQHQFVEIERTSAAFAYWLRVYQDDVR